MELDPFQDKTGRFGQKTVAAELAEADGNQPLPSRREYHQQKKRKAVKTQEAVQENQPEEENQTERTLQNPAFPLLKVLLAFFILMPIAVFAAYTYFSSHPSLTVSAGDHGVGEEITYATQSDGGTKEKVKEKVTNNNPSSESGETKRSLAPSKNEAETASAKPKKPRIPSEKHEEKAASQETAKEPAKPKKTAVNAVQAEPSHEQVLYHKVQPKETLFSISMKYYHSQEGEDIIRQWNHLSDNGIQSGQVLKIVIPEKK